MIFLSLITSLLFTSPSMQTFHVKVLSYNIHHAEGTDGKVDIERIAHIIRESGADVVCLQEVDQHLSRTERMDMPALLSKALDMEAIFGANYHFDDGHYGNLTLSRFPIEYSENISLPNPSNKEPRGCLRTDIVIPGSYSGIGNLTFSIFNTHLGLNPEERYQQAIHIIAQIQETAIVVLAGDLNEESQHKGLQYLLEKLRDAGDAKNQSSQEARKAVKELGEGYTIPSNKPIKRIDFLLANTNIDGLSVIKTDMSAIASDHLPIVGRFYVKDDMPNN